MKLQGSFVDLALGIGGHERDEGTLELHRGLDRREASERCQLENEGRPYPEGYVSMVMRPQGLSRNLTRYWVTASMTLVLQMFSLARELARVELATAAEARMNLRSASEK